MGGEASTPNLDRFREDAVAFTRAYSHANTTLPSHVTMMTGKLMPEHGVDHNFYVPDSRHLFLSERLRETGAHSGGFVGIQFLEKLYASKMNGMDRYFDLPDARVAQFLLQRLGIKGARRGAAKTAGKALHWIKKHRSTDAFCWLHLFDTHMAYQAGGRWRKLYDVPEGKDEITLSERVAAENLVAYHPLGDERHHLEYYPRMYKAAMSDTDEVVGRFMGSLRDMGLYDEALIIVTGDHGENLTENGVYCGHSLLFDETIRVPLLVKFPGKQHAGEEVRDPVGHRDLMPTVLRHFHLECNCKPCRDLGTYLSSGDAAADPPLLAFHNRMFQGAVRKGPWTWIENLDLAKVPDSRRLLYENVGLFDAEGRKAEEPSTAAEMSRILHDFLDGTQPSHDVEGVEEESIKTHLRELGYL
jgi:arylsulfatase A-like enzyme